MPEPLHLLIDGAAPGDAPPPALPALPRLDALLRRLRPAGLIECDDDAPDTPFERALALAHGLPGAPGQRPWAAFEHGIVGTPCAWLRPCHWQIGMDSVRVLEPARLDLPEAESRALLATVQALLAEDDIALRYVRPDAWLAQGELFRGLTTWSLARALQRPLTPDALAAASAPAQGARLRRLQNECQMLLHTHAVNEAREAARQWPVNALWIEGTGALQQPAAPARGVRIEPRLAQAGGDPTAQTAAWQAIDADSFATLAQALDAGVDVQLTLCSTRRAITLTGARGGLWPRISSVFRPMSAQSLREQL